jgi:C-terminal processing protease CtpA/Prc
MYADNINAADTISFASINPFPKKIIILINKNTASSGELFAIMSSSSKKVEIHGENSAGIIDSDNVLIYPTSCSNVRLSIPFGIRRWFEKGISYDKMGIVPDKKYGSTKEDWIEKAYRYLLNRIYKQ